MLVMPDHASGVLLWVVPPQRGADRSSRPFTGAFDPDAVIRWLADSGTATSGRLPLVATDGTELRLLPAVDLGGKMNLEFRSSGEGDAWNVEGSRADADSLVQILAGAAQQSRLVADGPIVRVDTDSGRYAFPEMRSTIVPLMPRELRGRPGRVELSFVVRNDGSVDPGSFVALRESDAGLADVAIVITARHSRFTPGAVDGHPVAMRVSQVVEFSVR